VSGVRYVLASASPRRRHLIELLGVTVEVIPAQIDESPVADETPIAMVLRLASAKAHAVADRLAADGPAVVIAADTTVDLDGRVFGTPVDVASARSMLGQLAGRTHVVHTAVVVLECPSRRESSRVVSSEVDFIAADATMIERYVATAEPLDKAGGYGIQGLGAALVSGVRGSLSNVVGLPIEELRAMLERTG